MSQHNHDFAKLAREDPVFRETIMQAIETVASVETRNRPRALMMALEACQYNTGFLLPWFFPHFGGPNSPMTLSRRPFAFPMYSMLTKGYLVVKGSRQISKSTNMSARQLMLTQLMPWASIYIAPHLDHIKTYATKLRDMERCFRYSLNTKGYRNNLQFKEYKLGSRIELHRVLTSASHMRGKTADELLYDEYQLFDIRLEAEIRQLQRNTTNPVTIYSGTSTTIDSPLENRFQKSSGGVWMMRSPNGKDFIDCSDGVQVLKMIRREGLTCPFTDRLITNPLDGEFAHAAPALLDQNILGIHIPQFLIPDFLTPAEWPKIFNYLQDFGETRTLQEVGGIATEEGFKEISQKDMQAICTLPYRDIEQFRRAIKTKNPYRFIVSGCDWGGSDAQMSRLTKTSYTVHVILGVYGDGKMDILYMRRYSGMQYDEIAESILKAHADYGGTAIASDFGAGLAYNTYLHRDARVNPNRHFVWGYSPPYLPMIMRPQFQQFPAQYMLNKTESITQLFEAIKKQRIRCYAWDAASTFLDDFLNSQRVHAETRHGRQYFLHIRNSTKADDTMHAVNFAFVLARLLLKEPMFDDPNLRNYVNDQLNGSSGGLHTGNMADFRSMVVKG